MLGQWVNPPEALWFVKGAQDRGSLAVQLSPQSLSGYLRNTEVDPCSWSVRGNTHCLNVAPDRVGRRHRGSWGDERRV